MQIDKKDRIILSFGEEFFKHAPPFSHPENPERLKLLYEELNVLSNEKGYIHIPPEGVDIEEILPIHSEGYIKALSRMTDSLGIDGYRLLDPDTFLVPSSLETAFIAVGTVIRCMKECIEHGIPGFALVRPPGHHAERNRAMGFCIFNNVAVAAHHSIEKLGMEKVFIFDFDLHHGNGTQNAFYKSDRVFYSSLHQSPLYPGTGMKDETGKGDGEGFNMNLPLPAGCGEGDYLLLLKEVVIPVINAFKPSIILVSAGFDCHLHDPLSGMFLKTLSFEKMARELKSIADEVSEGRLLFVLEGGYNPKILKDSCLALLNGLHLTSKDEEENMETPNFLTTEFGTLFLKEVKESLGRYWKVF